MLETPQFLNILEAESQHLVTVSITLPHESKAEFERDLNDAYASDSYSDAAKAWNEERSRVVQEAMDQHLIPHGSKWTANGFGKKLRTSLRFSVVKFCRRSALTTFLLYFF